MTNAARCARWIMLPVLALGICGCDRPEATRGKSSAAPASYGALPGLRASHHPGLQDELARIVAEKGTPELLMTRPSGGGTGSAAPVSDAENAAVLLAKLFAPHELQSVGRRLERFFPLEQFEFSDEDLLAVQRVLDEFAVQRTKFRTAIARPQCDFHWPHTSGLLADLTPVDAMRAGVRLEMLAAALDLRADRLGDAAESLGIMLRAIAFLAAPWHVVPRLEAAHAREEALLVVAALAQHPLATRALHEQLFRLLDEQLAAWPPDAHAWIGERADGLHTYEFVRAGQLLSVLNHEEMQRLQQSGNAAAKLTRIKAEVDQDEFFYLTVMRRLIDSCQRPYFERRKLFAQLRTEMSEASRTSDDPYVARELLLQSFEAGHRRQARDRALCEGWALALGLATEQELTTEPINPLTGAAYQRLNQPTQVAVWGVLLAPEDRQLVVPKL